MLSIYYGHRVTAMNPRPAFGPDVGNLASPETIEQFLDDRREWTAVTLDEIQSRGGELVRSADSFFALTFDDGYLDNLTTLLPILESRNTPAGVFVTTGFVNQELEPYEYALARLISTHSTINLSDSTSADVETSDEKSHHYEELRRRWKKRSNSDRKAWMATLQSLNGDLHADPPARYILDWGEVAELDDHPLITIGAHTHTHQTLRGTSPRQALREMRTSRSQLEGQLRHQIEYLAYPYGSSDLIVRAIATQAGFSIALSTEERTVTLRDLKRPLALPRFDLNRSKERCKKLLI